MISYQVPYATGNMVTIHPAREAAEAAGEQGHEPAREQPRETR
jgi:hypothetical protein